jgi:hypothetical protein
MDFIFDLSKIPDRPSKEQLAKEAIGVPQFPINRIHGKCEGDFHNNPEQRNAYMKKYNKKYRVEKETPEQRERRRQNQKLLDAKRYEIIKKNRSAPKLKMDDYNIKRREAYRLKVPYKLVGKESISC